MLIVREPVTVSREHDPNFWTCPHDPAHQIRRLSLYKRTMRVHPGWLTLHVRRCARSSQWERHFFTAHGRWPGADQIQAQVKRLVQ